MLARLTTNQWDSYGFHKEKLVEVLATRTNSSDVLIDVALGAVYFPDVSIVCSPHYSHEEHRRGKYAWARQDQLKIIGESLTNRSAAGLFLAKEEL